MDLDIKVTVRRILASNNPIPPVISGRAGSFCEQDSRDGKHGASYPFRYLPQVLKGPLEIYAPYQSHFDWNLWFA